MNNLGALDVTVPVVAEAFSKVSVLVDFLYQVALERTFANVLLMVCARACLTGRLSVCMCVVV